MRLYETFTQKNLLSESRLSLEKAGFKVKYN